MNTVQASVGLDATALKLLGVVTMTVDHIGYILCPDLVLLRILGRLAYPIFAYLIAEGCTYSKHKAKYFLAVLGTGLLCSIASYGAEHTLYQSIMITFACSIGLISFRCAFGKSQTFVGLERSSPSFTACPSARCSTP